MCGIAAILRIHDPADGDPPPHYACIPEAWLDVLDASIKHRGPDGAGRFRDRVVRSDGTVVDVALVHRRLSIIDHAGGWQPMVHVRRSGKEPERGPGASLGLGAAADLESQSPGLRPGLVSESIRDGLVAPTRFVEDRIGGRPEGIGVIDLTGEVEPVPEGLAGARDVVAVTFNGCIYNHRELRAELEACGHRFGSDHSDTEVLVHGWREWGLGIQDRLDGMYAVLVWDRAQARIAWGRDLVGEKPIYLENEPKLYQFCSSPCPTLIVPPKPPYRPSREAGWWIKQGVHRWLPNSQFDLPPRRWEQTKLWEHRDTTLPTMKRAKAPHREPSLPQRAHESGLRLNAAELLIERAVISRLEADVPLGVFLSGGIDSGLIAAVAKRHRPDLKTFTVRMPDPRYDESDAALETARHLGTDHATLECEPRPADDLIMLIEQLGLPFGDSSLLPTYWVAKAAREHVKVALSGDGGDELFGGYRRHTITPELNRWRRVLRLIPDRLLDRRRPGSRSTYLARLAVAARHLGYADLLAIFPTPDLQNLIRSIDGEPVESAEFRDVEDPLRHDFMHYLPDDLLRKTDTASMAVGLEVRAPFLARELVDAALRTPLELLMPGGERKGLLKRVARQYLPASIVDRPKQGFAIPVGEWFRTDFGGMRTLLRDHLESAEPFPGLAEAGLELDLGFVRRMLREHDDAGGGGLSPWRGRDHSQRLYMLLVLSIWCRWLVGLGADGLGYVARTSE